MKRIESSDNAQIKNIIKLQDKAKERNEQGLYVIEGVKLFEEALKYHKDGIVKVYVSEEFYKEICESYKDYFRDIHYEIVKQHVFVKAARTVSSQGILAVMKQVKTFLDDILIDKSTNLLLLWELRDPGNLGTIIRTAEGAGFSAVILSSGCVDIYNPKVIRSTMGSIFRLPFIYTENMGKTIKMLKEKHFTIYAAHLDGSIDYKKACFTDKNAVLIGNEANGISDEIAMLCDVKIRIPMQGKLESLNAAVAAALIMYEAVRLS